MSDAAINSAKNEVMIKELKEDTTEIKETLRSIENKLDTQKEKCFHYRSMVDGKISKLWMVVIAISGGTVGVIEIMKGFIL